LSTLKSLESLGANLNVPAIYNSIKFGTIAPILNRVQRFFVKTRTNERGAPGGGRGACEESYGVVGCGRKRDGVEAWRKGAVPAHARGKEERMANFLFVLSRDDNEAATRCFQFAKIAHSKGHKVNLFLIDDGVFWADKNRVTSNKAYTGDCPEDYLPYLVENEVPVGV
jgi:hypothetical protein